MSPASTISTLASPPPAYTGDLPSSPAPNRDHSNIPSSPIVDNDHLSLGLSQLHVQHDRPDAIHSNAAQAYEPGSTSTPHIDNILPLPSLVSPPPAYLSDLPSLSSTTHDRESTPSSPTVDNHHSNDLPSSHVQADSPDDIPPSDVPPDDVPSSDTPAYPVFVPSPHIDELLPPRFNINRKDLAPLVEPSELQAHLVLLGAFHRLRSEVGEQRSANGFPLTSVEMWAIFLQRAVHRFQLWAQWMNWNEESTERGLGYLAFDECPPLDVMMVWHTYMLNPRTYYEDCLRMNRGLLKIGSFPLGRMATTIDSKTLLPYPPEESRATLFSSFTGESFDPPLQTTLEDVVTLQCPVCSALTAAPWITREGTGYAQRKFAATCSARPCGRSFDRETLGVRKFYEDMEKCMAEPDKYFLANTLVDHFTGTPVRRDSQSFNTLIFRSEAHKNLVPMRPGYAGMRFGWGLEDVGTFLRASSIPSAALNLIQSAYCHPGPFSMDLASAVLRQMNFIEKMVGFGWTESGRFDEDNVTLTRCVVRYHAFLDLINATPGKFVVPTLDIDLAWHTHQLRCLSYRKLLEIIGTIPDHDDKVSQDTLSSSYDYTAEIWKRRFGVPYSVCGCLPPSTRLKPATLISLFKKKDPSSIPTLINLHPDLISTDDATANETHPSDHNGVAILNSRDASRAKADARRHLLDQRAKQITSKLKKAARATGDAAVELQWEAMQLERNRENHTQAFLAPVEFGVKYVLLMTPLETRS
ncbi:hypothetical protein FRB99_008774 [Tulasnella sp. 403]|nr:hypothetical protein FRB99_008774 [Tulasnella sp. 403]